MSQERPRIVIAGAGFGGLETANALKAAPADVIVIDRQNHHCFQPLLYQVATAALSTSAGVSTRTTRAAPTASASRSPASAPDPPAVTTVTGSPVTADDMPLHLRKARLTRVSIEANSGICRGMLRHRYNDTRGQGETAPAGDSPEH